MPSKKLLVAALLGASSAAALPAAVPADAPVERGLVCAAVNGVVSLLSATASATPFCSSYLGIKTATAYTTSTATNYTTSYAYTTTGTDTVTAANVTAATSTLATVTAPTVTITATADAISVTTCISTAADIAKRGQQQTSTSTSSVKTSSTSTVKTSSTSSVKTSSSSTKTTSTSTSGAIATPDCLKGLAAEAVSLACSCLAVPTPTSTSTVVVTVHPTTVITSSVAATATFTPTVTPYFTPVVTPTANVTVTPTSTVNYCPSPTPDLSCNNQGVQWAYYYNNDGGNNDGVYSQFNPAKFKTVQPGMSGVAGSAAGFSYSCPSTSSTVNLYGYTTNCNYLVLNYRGYLYASQSGSFTFTVGDVDDFVEIWVGSIAYSGWTRANADAEYTLNDSGSFSFDATAGEYVPIRVMFAQGYGVISFSLEITAPDGTVVLGADSTTSDYLVQQSCDGTSAPAYPAFGSET